MTVDVSVDGGVADADGGGWGFDFGGCPPLFATRRDVKRGTLGGQIAALADVLGLSLMPWQRYVADVAFELDGAGGLRYREVNLTVPRQCGKSVFVLVVALHRMLVLGGVQRVTYAAQDVVGASRTWRTQLWPLVERSGLVEHEGLKLRRSLSDTGISCRNGSELSVLTSAPTSGHGTTTGLSVIDEAMSLVNNEREQALLPALRTVPNAQMWVVSTAGDDRSIYLYNKVRRGRERCTKNVVSQVAYFEWGADEKDDWTDRDVWGRAVPALGHTVSLLSLEHEFETMEPAEFRRACLNQWPVRSSDPVIAWPVWERACSEVVVPDGDLVLAVDAPPDRSSACLVVCGANGVVEVVAQRKGIDWVLDDIRGLHDRHGFTRIVGSRSSPVSAFLDSLCSYGLPVEQVNWHWMADACGKFADDVESGGVRLRSDARLDDAMVGAVRKPFDKGTKFTWWRDFRLLDISLLWAATMAYYASWRVVNIVAGEGPSFTVVDDALDGVSADFAATVDAWRSVWVG